MTAHFPPFDPTLVGASSEVMTIRVESGQLQFFAKATDQRDPVYFDIEAARTAGYRGLPVPLTFAYSLTLALPDQAAFGLIRIQADPRYILHAEQGFRNHRMIFGGDEVALQTQIHDIYDKKGGALRFLVQRTNLTGADGQLCVECDTTFVLRLPKG